MDVNEILLNSHMYDKWKCCYVDYMAYCQCGDKEIDFCECIVCAKCGVLFSQENDELLCKKCKLLGVYNDA